MNKLDDYYSWFLTLDEEDMMCCSTEFRALLKNNLRGICIVSVNLAHLLQWVQVVNCPLTIDQECLLVHFDIWRTPG